MRSFIIMAESTSTIIGVETISTEVEMGEVKLRPLKKQSIFSVTPKNAAAIMRGKSARSIFSARTFSGILAKSQDNQNKTVAPPTRIIKKP